MPDSSTVAASSDPEPCKNENSLPPAAVVPTEGDPDREPEFPLTDTDNFVRPEGLDQANIIDAQAREIVALKRRIDALERERQGTEEREGNSKEACRRCLKRPRRWKQGEAIDEGRIERMHVMFLKDLTAEGLTRKQSRTFLFTLLYIEEDDDKAEFSVFGVGRLSEIIAQVNEGKSLQYFSVFENKNDIHFVLKYETPTRWKQLADTLRNKYGIIASVSCAIPKTGYRTCMYPVLFSYCLDLDPNFYLSPNHPHPSSLLGDGEKQGSRARRTPALDGGGLPALPPSRGAEEEEETGILEHVESDGVSAVSAEEGVQSHGSEESAESLALS
ncbi:hypothetical protein FOZ60_005534 [Perkinsus olseni]|uniref:Uncharacterized protein n=1 Tax=Perkinsus olseni TaxID=32597 RepID=A0A7J6PI93_PEROL|nr:hypothetical protein FOZ60_005534 [Perkinsus olseni]